MILHAGLLALRHREYWRGVLITGPSGAGKSDLALRLMEAGFSLVADDRTLVWTSAGTLYGRAPDALAGKIEARGLGIIAVSPIAFAPVALIVDLDPTIPLERMPEYEAQDVLGVAVPRVRLAAFEASSPAKLRRWLIALG